MAEVRVGRQAAIINEGKINVELICSFHINPEWKKKQSLHFH